MGLASLRGQYRPNLSRKRATHTRVAYKKEEHIEVHIKNYGFSRSLGEAAFTFWPAGKLVRGNELPLGTIF